MQGRVEARQVEAEHEFNIKPSYRQSQPVSRGQDVAKCVLVCGSRDGGASKPDKIKAQQCRRHLTGIIQICDRVDFGGKEGKTMNRKNGKRDGGTEGGGQRAHWLSKPPNVTRTLQVAVSVQVRGCGRKALLSGQGRRHLHLFVAL